MFKLWGNFNITPKNKCPDPIISAVDHISRFNPKMYSSSKTNRSRVCNDCDDSECDCHSPTSGSKRDKWGYNAHIHQPLTELSKHTEQSCGGNIRVVLPDASLIYLSPLSDSGCRDDCRQLKQHRRRPGRGDPPCACVRVCDTDLLHQR